MESNFIYAKFEKVLKSSQILLSMADDEHTHAQIWEQYTKEHLETSNMEMVLSLKDALVELIVAIVEVTFTLANTKFVDLSVGRTDILNNQKTIN